MLGDTWSRATYVQPAHAPASRPTSTSTTAASRSGRWSRSISPGSSSSEVGIEVSGRQLAIVGERPVQETEGRVYQQVEIPSGPVPARSSSCRSTSTPSGPRPPTRTACCGSSCRCATPPRPPGGCRYGRAELMEGSPVLEVVESPLDAEDAIRADAAAARRAAGPAAARDGHLPRDADPAGGRPGALDQAGQRRARRQPDAGHGRLARPRERGARPRRTSTTSASSASSPG